MIGATTTQLPEKATNEMVTTKMKHVPLLEMGNKTCQHTKRTSRHSRELELKSLLKTYMKDELKETI